MPDPLVVLDRARIPVQPGSQVTVRVRVTNTDLIVNGFRIDVVGRGPADWAEAGPSEIRMMPHEEETVVVTFSPPAGPSAPGGTYPFGVRAVAIDDEDSSAVAEGDLEVGNVVGLHAKLIPINSSGRWQGKHTVHVSNSGNTTARLTLSGSDVDEALGFLIRPRAFDVGLGETVVARVRVRTRRPSLRGMPARIPFSIVAEPADTVDSVLPPPAHATLERPVVEGAFNQRPILARFVLPFLLFALLVGAAGSVYQLKRPLPHLQVLGDGSVPKVEGLTASAVDAHTIQLTWYRVAGIDRYFIQRYADNGKSPEQSHPASNQDTALPIADLPPGQEKCFTIRAIRGDQEGEESKPECATTPPESTPSASPGGPTVDPPVTNPQFTTVPPTTGSPSTGSPSRSTRSPGRPGTSDLIGKYIAVGHSVSQLTTEQSYFDEDLAKLAAADLTSAKVISSQGLTFETLFVGPPSWMLIAGPYESERTARQDACPRMEVVRSFCRVVLVREA